MCGSKVGLFHGSLALVYTHLCHFFLVRDYFVCYIISPFHHVYSIFFLLETLFKLMYLKEKCKNFGRKRKTFPKHCQF